MYYKLLKSNADGKNSTLIVISPEDSLEREFFNLLFKGEVEFVEVPNSDEIMIRKKEDVKAIDSKPWWKKILSLKLV